MDKEKSTIFNQILHINNQFEQTKYKYTFLDVQTMDFLIRKTFRRSEIEYLYTRSDKSIIINNDNAPFKVFIQPIENGYIRVRKIPIDNFEFHFFARDPADLLRKMVDKGIITVRQFRQVIQSQKQERAIKREALKYINKKTSELEN